jgi:hypothetical protein
MEARTTELDAAVNILADAGYVCERTLDGGLVGGRTRTSHSLKGNPVYPYGSGDRIIYSYEYGFRIVSMCGSPLFCIYGVTAYNQQIPVFDSVLEAARHLPRLKKNMGRRMKSLADRVFRKKFVKVY